LFIEFLTLQNFFYTLEYPLRVLGARCTQQTPDAVPYARVARAAGRRDIMSEVTVKKDESLDSALKRFKRNCQKAGIMGEVRKREHYDKPSVKRKKKSEAAAKKRKYY